MRWGCLALCEATRKVATATGHFAQHLHINAKTSGRFTAQRRRSVWKEWLLALNELGPLGSARWRMRNRSYRSDASQLLTELRSEKCKPTVIYADPPYTQDQYSRYYHMYETVLLYDYPSTAGAGRYRQGRFVSPFCLKTKVVDAFETLADRARSLRATLIVSYPNNGVLADAKRSLPLILKRAFRNCVVQSPISHFHSSMGGSKGVQKHSVREYLFIAS